MRKTHATNIVIVQITRSLSILLMLIVLIARSLLKFTMWLACHSHCIAIIWPRPLGFPVVPSSCWFPGSQDTSCLCLFVLDWYWWKVVIYRHSSTLNIVHVLELIEYCNDLCGLDNHLKSKILIWTFGVILIGHTKPNSLDLSN